MRAAPDNEQVCLEFEVEFKKFTDNISRLIDEIGVPAELKTLYSDAVFECGDIRDACREAVSKCETAIKFQLRELMFYNRTCDMERGRQKKCGVKRLLDAGGVILESINKFITGSKFGIILDVLQELIKLTTGLYYKDDGLGF